ncbi:MAG: DUF4292 domain-containing protein [Candidatus Kapaibacteriales bacterium]
MKTIAFIMMIMFLNIVMVFSQNEVVGLQKDTISSKVLQFRGKISILMSGMNLTGQFSASLVGEDSATLSFYGPMGVILGKVFANKNYFAFYDVMNNWAVVGKPTRENIFASSRVPLSFEEFVRLFRGEITVDYDSLRLLQEQSNREKTLYYKTSDQFVDFFLLNNNNNKILQYQKKTRNGQIIINLNITEYTEFEGNLYPKRYVMQISERRGNVVMEIDDIQSSENFSKPFSFVIPKGVEIFPYFDEQTQ